MNHDIEIESYDEIDLFAKDKKCPICNSNLIQRFPLRHLSRHCNNECYKYDCYLKSNGYKEYAFSIFGFDFNISAEDELEGIHESIFLDIKKEIFYWKENDRYLAKIIIDS
ncbi:hypothetical protein D3C87_76830 [compost metagenome]